MAQKDRKRQQQKRQAKLAKRKSKEVKRKQTVQKTESLAYHGSKYRNAKYVELIFATESGICFAYQASGRKLTDSQVVLEIEQLIADIRHGKIDQLLDDLPPVPEDRLIGCTTWGILSYWERYFETHGILPQADLVGILRTTLGAVATWTGPQSRERGYLKFSEEFLTEKAGIEFDVEEDLANRARWAEEPDEFDEDEDSLLMLGQWWQESSLRQARTDFETEANHRILTGRGSDVVAICRELLDETDNGMIVRQLRLVLTQAEAGTRLPDK